MISFAEVCRAAAENTIFPAPFSSRTGAVSFPLQPPSHLHRLNQCPQTPRKIDIINPAGPYGPGKTDDKPFLYTHNGTYYLTWGCFYSTGASPYGPFTFGGAQIHLLPAGVSPGRRRHGQVRLLRQRDGSAWAAGEALGQYRPAAFATHPPPHLPSPFPSPTQPQGTAPTLRSTARRTLPTTTAPTAATTTFAMCSSPLSTTTPTAASPCWTSTAWALARST